MGQPPYGSSMVLYKTRKPNDSFEDFTLKFSAEGLIEVRAYSPGIVSADDGTQVRSRFDEFRKLISPSVADTCNKMILKSEDEDTQSMKRLCEISGTIFKDGACHAK